MSRAGLRTVTLAVVVLAAGCGNEPPAGRGDAGRSNVATVHPPGRPTDDLVAAGAGGRSLARFAGQRVEAEGVRVLSVVGAAGVWVGRSDFERIFVEVDTGVAGVRPPEAVDFAGRVVANRAPSAYGLSVPGDVAVFRAQRYHVRVPALRRG